MSELGPSDLASAIGLEPADAFPPVFSTSRMVALMELAAARVLRPHLRLGALSVGVSLEVAYTAATPPGATVTATARFHRHCQVPRARGKALPLRGLGCGQRRRDRPLHAQARGRHRREARRRGRATRSEGL